MDKDLNRLTVIVKSSDSVLFEGKAKSVSTVNEKGPLDILPMHENFISIIKERIKIVDENGKATDLKIDTGIIKAHENHVNVFLGVGTEDTV